MEKQPYEWTEEDIQHHIDHEIEENIQLDYKACDALQKTEGKKKIISVDVSAFANSAGGTIIYGVKEHQEEGKNHLPENIDSGFVPTDISKEWLEQVINSRIQPRIDGIIINPVKLSGKKEGKYIYVVDIPQSHTAHQASDLRYYKRFNFESVPMQDYEIRDILNRKKTPTITPIFSKVVVNCTEARHDYLLNCTLSNTGHMLVKDWAFFFAYPKVVINKDTVSGYRSRKEIRKDLRFYNATSSMEYIQLEFRSVGGVFFPSEELVIFDRGLGYYVDNAIHENRSKYIFYWALFADDMHREYGSFKLEEYSDF
ncbi:MAG: ATP-binding protein [bacterium]|nr:ATP-binding protein [bacterium]